MATATTVGAGKTTFLRQRLGSLLRAKCVLAGRDGSRLELQLVGRRLTVSETLPDISCRFTCIGQHLDRERLAACFAAAGHFSGGAHGCP